MFSVGDVVDFNAAAHYCFTGYSWFEDHVSRPKPLRIVKIESDCILITDNEGTCLNQWYHRIYIDNKTSW